MGSLEYGQKFKHNGEFHARLNILWVGRLSISISKCSPRVCKKGTRGETVLYYTCWGYRGDRGGRREEGGGREGKENWRDEWLFFPPLLSRLPVFLSQIPRFHLPVSSCLPMCFSASLPLYLTYPPSCFHSLPVGTPPI